MATYTYKCLDCAVSFDVEATIKEKEDGRGESFMCPKCGSANIKQEFSITSFVKNVFKDDEEKGGCCSDKNCCDVDCAPEENDPSCGGSCCSSKKGGGSCCG